VQRLHQFFHQNLTRGSGVSSKLRTTAAVSSVSLNWGMVTVLRVYAIFGVPYTSDRQGKRAAIGTRHTFRLSTHSPIAFGDGPDVKPDPASPESAGMSKAAFDRLEAHLKHRYIDAGRFPGTQLLVYRRGKVVHSAVQGFADIERKAPMKDDKPFFVSIR